MMYIWYTSYIPDIHIYTTCMHHIHMMYDIQYIWCIYDVCMIYIHYIWCIYMMYVWYTYIHDVYMIYIHHIYQSPLALVEVMKKGIFFRIKQVLRFESDMLRVSFFIKGNFYLSVKFFILVLLNQVVLTVIYVLFLHNRRDLDYPETLSVIFYLYEIILFLYFLHYLWCFFFLFCYTLFSD